MMTGTNKPAVHPPAGISLLILVMLFWCVIWWILNVHFQREFWGVSSDYPSHSLSHAINIEGWIRSADLRDVSDLQTMHPGIPFQVTSWLAYRLAVATYPRETGGPIPYTLLHPETFWWANQLSALLCGLAGTVLVWRLARNSGLLITLAALSAFWTFAPSWNFGLLTLGNDSFALLFAAVFFGLARQALAANDAHSCWRTWAGLGVMGGLVYLNKLNYVAWPMAVAVGLCVQAAFKKMKLSVFIIRCLCLAGGFGVAVVTVGLFFLGPEGLKLMAGLHFGVLTHSGLYGTGQLELVSSSAVSSALRELGHSVDLWLVPLTVSILGLLLLFQRRADQNWRATNLPYGICLFTAIALGYAATLKHFVPHYLIPVAAVLPLAVVWLGKPAGKFATSLLGITILCSVCLAGVAAVRAQRYTRRLTKAMTADCRAVRELPQRPHEVILWAHRVTSRPFASLAALYYSTTPDRPLKELATLFPTDAAYFWWEDKTYYQGKLQPTEQVPWRYAVFELIRYPDFASLPEYFRQHAKRIGEFQRVLVVEHTDLAPIAAARLNTESRIRRAAVVVCGN